MHVSFSLFADAANISREGKLNILGVFDAVQVAQLPALHPRTTFVLRLKATAQDAGVHPLILRWMNPKGNELWNSQAELEIAGAPPGTSELDMPVIIQLDLPLDTAGEYRMIINVGSQHTATCTLNVHAQPQQPSLPAQNPGIVS
jgi:hypothetical protein